MLAREMAAAASLNYQITAVDLPDFDMSDRRRVLAFVDAMKPGLIINCAAYTNVDGCENEQDLAEQVNGDAVGYLGEAAEKVGAVLVHISTDYVFDGSKSTPYTEEDSTNPQSAYGRSKLFGEQALLSSGLSRFYIVRTSWLYGPGGQNFVETIIRLSKERPELGIVADQIGSPTYTADLAAAILDLIDTSSPYGIYHYSNQGQCSWYEFSVKIVELARARGEFLKVETIKPIRTEDYPLPAERPKYSVFSKEKYQNATGRLVPSWEESLARYFELR